MSRKRKERGHAIYLTAAEQDVMHTILYLSRGCGELDDMPAEQRGSVDMEKLLLKFGVAP